MARLFSIAALLLTVVALAAHNVKATKAAGCATAEFRNSADAEFRGRVQSAYEESAKKRHSLTSVAHGQVSPPPVFADLREMRGYMKKIDDTVRSMSVQEREKALGNVREFIDKLAPKTILDAEFLHAIQFSGKSLGWAVDWNGTIERTTDGGLTWNNTRIANPPWLLQRTHPAAGLFRNMHFADAKFGLVVGLGPPYRTTDGGLTWHPASPPTPLILLQSVFCDPAHGCWVAGDKQNAIYRSEAAQSKWTLQRSPAKGVITAIQFLGPNGWAVSNLGEIVGTTDGGQHWNELFRDETKKFYALHFVDEHNGWAVGDRALIMRTQDGGKTWLDQTIPTPPGFPIDELRLEAVNFTNANQGWAAGLNGIILGTTDGGKCWMVQRFEGFVHSLTIYSLAITEGPTVWAAGNIGNIFVSTDGGAFWFPVHGVALDVMHEIKRTLDKVAKQ